MVILFPMLGILSYTIFASGTHLPASGFIVVKDPPTGSAIRVFRPTIFPRFLPAEAGSQPVLRLEGRAVPPYPHHRLTTLVTCFNTLNTCFLYDIYIRKIPF